VKIRVLPLALTIAMAATGAARANEVIATSCIFKASHSANASYHLDALYSGQVEANKWEEAAASTPVHPGDERWCHWKIQSRITRKILFVYKRGVEGALDATPPTDVWYSVTIYGEGRPHQNCESSSARFQSDYVHAVSGLTRDFDKVVVDDTPNAQKAIRVKIPDLSNVELED
jgi:hypothetical protein